MNDQSPVHRTTRSITILDLRDSPWVDGPGRTILDCAESLTRQGYRFVIGAFVSADSEEGEYIREAKRRGLEVVCLRETGQFDWRILTQLKAIMASMNVDIVHTHDPRTNLIGLIGARLFGKPVITTVHGWIANTPKRKLYRMIDKCMIRFFDHIISVSERTRSLIRQSWIADRKITVIANALKVDQYVPDRGHRQFRLELGLNNEQVLIANIGRLSPEKGHMDFLIAAQEILKTYPNARFVLIGIGPEQERLESYVKENGIGQYVYFAGFRKDMQNIYNSVDLVVQSSYTEGMPNVILEALLMEVPVIASDVGGTAEVLDGGKYGLLNQPGEPPSLAADICEFLRDSDNLQERSRLGRSGVLRKYDHEERVRKLSALYRSLLNH